MTELSASQSKMASCSRRSLNLLEGYMVRLLREIDSDPFLWRMLLKLGDGGHESAPVSNGHGKGG